MKVVSQQVSQKGITFYTCVYVGSEVPGLRVYGERVQPGSLKYCRLLYGFLLLHLNSRVV